MRVKPVFSEATYADYDCPKCGAQVYDNTENKRNPRAPDFKCSDRDCDYVVWPPRGNNRSAPPARRKPPPSEAPYPKTTRPAGNDDRSNRIERQHSQEMALRWITVKFKDETPTTDQLRALIDWFQRDIGRSPEKQPVQQEDPLDEHPMNPANQEGYDEDPF